MTVSFNLTEGSGGGYKANCIAIRQCQYNMDFKKLICGDRIDLKTILDARDHRVEIQREMLQRNSVALISFTLNIAGPIKVFPLTASAYEEGVRLIQFWCRSHQLQIVEQAEVREPSGYECFLSVSAPVEKVKATLCKLEESNDLGRLFDIDVLDTSGEKISRTAVGLPERKCLICDERAVVCGRSRAHSIEELQEQTCKIIWTYFFEKYAEAIASVASRALLHEVMTTPKPGLVDRQNNGAHSDMDVFTFEDSALALMPYFKAFVSSGISHGDDAASAILPQIRPIGIQAEISMLSATGGVNTHKGIIFSLGIICAALGRLYSRQEAYSRSALQLECMEIAAPVAEDFCNLDSKAAMTNGEKLYSTYHIRGIRGEAAGGFPILFSVALPRFQQLRESGLNLNDVGALTLLSIIASSEDTNIISRSSYEDMLEIQKRMQALAANSPETQDYLGILNSLDEEFIGRNISPGGSADILALAYFIHFLEQELPENPHLARAALPGAL